MSMDMRRARADAESRQSEEKKVAEKRRNIIVLCTRYFQDLGFINTVQQIQNDTNISLDKVDVADNIDLGTILTEYEDFYEMRFGRKPKITRKVASEKELDRKVSLPRIPTETSHQARDCEGADGKRPRASNRSKSREDSSRRERPPAAPVQPGKEPAPPNAGSDGAA
eukprot:CAMPEP_0179270382 /NCGR_PEP_ID=MMETSP0797-20121207/31440_1 /TAXON_ID=47934 /ORGANISM="Dinophysis acuminata, Strain DAEP01" /LENGTH=167 /DNA_ID=CAMNT_0020978719 /DNA_START=27 /DNA_END=527 /DNA_ORIENTATION=-